ncbi:MAG: alpha/beta fold hydrolase [Actinocrinis sp.]
MNSTPGPERVSQPVPEHKPVTKRLDVGEAVLAYDEAGHGPIVVYAHGLTSSRRGEDAWTLMDWSPLVAAGHRLVRYDARGHGESTGRPVFTDYTWEHLSGDLFAILDEVAGAEPADVIGASMGCGTLLHAAVRRPERFARLVLAIPPTAWETRPPVATANNTAADIVQSRGRAFFFEAIRGLPLPPVQSGKEGTPPPPDISEALYPHVMRGSAATDLPDPEELRGLWHETLILAWSADPSHPVSTAEKLNALLPNAHLHITQDYEDLKTWGNRVAAFLTR